MSDEAPATAAWERPGPIGRWRNRIALRVLGYVATPGLREHLRKNYQDATRWRETSDGT